ncbi:MAG: hypothetical protein HY000_17010, partial [Planctomycetes bacterium]|nr:hypothetical protein [Planctomycetota bacterium]
MSVVEAGATDTYTVKLTTQPTTDVTITLTPDSQVSVSPAALTFTSSNWNTARTVTVTAVDDGVDEASPHTGTISHSASSSDANYNGIGIPSVTANVTDNDTAGVTITQSGGVTNVTEGGATDTYTVVLATQPTADVTITLMPDSQVPVSPPTLTFTSANWNTARTVTVTAVDASVDEASPHAGTISHSASSSDANYNGIAVASVAANVTDNDTVGVVITQSGGSTNVVEGGVTDTYTVVLTTQPTADVTITLMPDGLAANADVHDLQLEHGADGDGDGGGRQRGRAFDSHRHDQPQRLQQRRQLQRYHDSQGDGERHQQRPSRPQRRLSRWPLV